MLKPPLGGFFVGCFMNVTLTSPLSSICSEVRSHYVELFKDSFLAAGFTEMSKSRPLQMYNQCRSRLQVLNDCYFQLLNDCDSYDGDEYDLLTDDLIQQMELVQDVLAQLDIYNTIDHTPSGCLEFDAKYGESPSKVLRRYIKNNPARDVLERFGVPKRSSPMDEARAMLVRAQAGSRRSFMIQRIHNEMQLRHSQGWFVVFDTLTLAPDRLSDFYANDNALRDYFRTVGRLVLQAEGRSLKESFSDCYRYLCVPEFGGKTGRLHFHVVHFLRTLPSGSIDPNFGRPAGGRYRRQLSSMSSLWRYGFSQPIAVRYAKDAFSSLGWLWPIDKKTGKGIESKPLIAIAHYVAKYINKQTEQSLVLKNLGDSKWKETLRQEMLTVPQKQFRVRMTRGFGMELPSMENLTNHALIQLTKLSSRFTKAPAVLKQKARKELKSRLAKLSLADCLELKPKTPNLLKLLRDSMQANTEFNPLSFMDTLTPKLASTDISEEVFEYVSSANLLRCSSDKPTFALGSK